MPLPRLLYAFGLAAVLSAGPALAAGIDAVDEPLPGTEEAPPPPPKLHKARPAPPPEEDDNTTTATDSDETAEPAPSPQDDAPPPRPRPARAPRPETRARPAEAAAPSTPTAADAGDAATEASGGHPAARSVPGPIAMASGSLADFLAHFRARQRALLEQNSKQVETESKALHDLRSDLAFPDLNAAGDVLVREGERRLSGNLGAQARASAELATELAPQLPQAWWLLARSELAANGMNALGAAVHATLQAVVAEVTGPLSGRALAAKVGLAALWAALIALSCALLLLALSVIRYALHDFHHLFPKGASEVQTALLGIAAVALPWLFHFGLFTILAGLSLLAWLYLSPQGRVVAALALIVPLATPALVGLIVGRTTVTPLALDLWTAERDLDADDAVARLKLLADQSLPSAVRAPLGATAGAPAPLHAAGVAGASASASSSSTPPSVLFVLAHRAKRLGDLDVAEGLYRRLLQSAPGRVDVENNLANVLLLKGDLKGAQALYESAIDRDPSRAAVYFNLGQDFNRLLQLEQSQEAQRHALELDRRLIEEHMSAPLRANLYLIDLGPAFSDVAALGTAADAAGGVRDQAALRIFGVLEPIWPGVALAVLALLTSLSLGGRRWGPSSACRKCGRAVCNRCDPGLPDEGLCGQCVNVFLRKTVADPPARIRKEARVKAYQLVRIRLVRLLSLLTGGGGYLALGDVGLGTAILFAAAFFVLSATRVTEVLRPAEQGVVPTLLAILSAIGLLWLYTAAVRDIFGRTR